MTDTPSGTSSDTTDIRPHIASPRSDRSIWLFAGGLGVAALLLFQALEARRTNLAAPSTIAPVDIGQGMVESVPELTIPPAVVPPALAWKPSREQNRVVPPAGAVVHRPPVAAQPAISMPSYPMAASPPPLSVETNYPPPPPSGTWASENGTRATPGPREADKDRVAAVRFSNPTTTVPKGTVVQAVLESALDSTRGGFARAIVSRNVFGFDGSRVLIPAGSRILGEYKSDVSLGQSRILIQWQRLMRPDGVMIDLDSPSADPLGRAGIKGSVNTHFFERFAGAILQSTLDIGVQLAARSATKDTVVVALPGGVLQDRPAVKTESIRPTVKVRQGSSVSVFVAKDLDFTDVDQ